MSSLLWTSSLFLSLSSLFSSAFLLIYECPCNDYAAIDYAAIVGDLLSCFFPCFPSSWYTASLYSCGCFGFLYFFSGVEDLSFSFLLNFFGLLPLQQTSVFQNRIFAAHLSLVAGKSIFSTCSDFLQSSYLLQSFS